MMNDLPPAMPVVDPLGFDHLPLEAR